MADKLVPLVLHNLAIAPISKVELDAQAHILGMFRK